MPRIGLAVVLALSLILAPLAVEAQEARKVYRIGILSTASPTSDMVGPQPRSPCTRALLGGLRELGYVYGEHFVTEPRGGEGKPERFADLAAELVRLQVDVIVSAGPQSMLAAVRRATSTIPVVTTGSGDPVGQGFAQSLARPGGNITGLSLQIPETTGKRLELLKELVPSAVLVVFSWIRENPNSPRRWPRPPLELWGESCCGSRFETPAGSRTRSRRARADDPAVTAAAGGPGDRITMLRTTRPSFVSQRV